MKYYGDVPVEDLELVKELTELEKWFDHFGGDISAEMAAKGMVAIAHDYCRMAMEEKANLLIRRAEILYPNYYKGMIHTHAKKDKDFAKIVSNLRASLGLELMQKYGFK